MRKKKDNEHKGRQSEGEHVLFFVCACVCVFARVCVCEGSSWTPSETEGSEREMRNTWHSLGAPTQTLTAYIPDRPQKQREHHRQNQPTATIQSRQTTWADYTHGQNPQPARPEKTRISYNCSTQQTQILLVHGGKKEVMVMLGYVYTHSRSGTWEHKLLIL